MSRRRPIVAGNWKMHLVASRAVELAGAVARGVAAETDEDGGPTVVLFPSHPLLPPVSTALDGSPVALGGQDLHPEDAGAHTGDTSGAQLADAGCTWVLVGHSERRHDHGEGDGLVAAKLRAARRNGLLPVLCVGETEGERNGGKTKQVLEAQLETGLFAALGAGDDLVLAYEPVWAIGTGETATPETAQAAHRYLRERVAREWGEERARALSILYGGSVKPGNATDLGAQEDVDGFLVGGASLDAEKFLAIIRCC